MVRSRLLAAMLLSGALLGSGSLAAQAIRGEKALEAEDYEKAVAAFKAETQNRKAKSWCNNSFLLGFAHYKNGQFPEAIAVFNDLFNNAEKLNCATYGLMPAWHFWRGLAYVQSGQNKEAAASFANAADLAPIAIPADFWPKWKLRGLQPTKELCYDWLGAAQRYLGAHQDAAGSYKKAIEINPKRGYYYSALARSYIELKQYDDALAAAKRGLGLEPDWYAHSTLGDLHAARKQYDEAIDAYRKAIENDPKRPDIHVKLGQAFLAKDDYDGAVGACTKAAELAPNDPGLPYLLGVIHSRAGKFDEAVASLDKAIGMATFVGIGIETGIENGQPVLQRLLEGPAKEAGLKAGDKLVKIDGQSTKGWDIKKTSQSLRGKENTQVVLTVQRQGEAKPFERAITRKLIIPKAAALYYGSRSLYAREKGDREGAVKDAGLAYSLDPDNFEAREALAAVNLDGGEYAEAIKLLSPLKDNPFARILEATAYAKQGDVKRAVEIYANIPEEELLANRVMRQNAKKALLQTLQGYVQERLDQARASESAGRFLEALSDYAEAMKIADNTTAGLIRQSVAITLKSNPYLAELPEGARKYALRGDVLIKEGGFADALAEYRTALKIAPFNAQLHFNTALIHGQLKDYGEAIKSMNVYLQLSPDAPNARAAKDEIYKWEFSLEKEGKK